MTDRTLFDPDPCAGKHGGAPTSADAWTRLLPVVGQQRAEVLAVIAAAGSHGATSKEVAASLGRPLNTISGRFVELLRLGRIVRTQARRGKSVVWVAV